jgi:serine/threonine protein kinase
VPAAVTLHVVAGPQAGAQHRFDEPTIAIAGRSRDCNVRLPNDEAHGAVSRMHCFLDVNPPSLRVRDFGSRNGTFVNGRLIGRREKAQSIEEGRKLSFPEIDLRDGDKVQIGTTVFEVRIQVPLACLSCGREASEAEARAASGPDWRCADCREKARGGSLILDGVLAGTRTCVRCGASVPGGGDLLRRGDVVCERCRNDTSSLLRDVLEAASGMFDPEAVRAAQAARAAAPTKVAPPTPAAPPSPAASPAPAPPPSPAPGPAPSTSPRPPSRGGRPAGFETFYRPRRSEPEAEPESRREASGRDSGLAGEPVVGRLDADASPEDADDVETFEPDEPVESGATQVWRATIDTHATHAPDAPPLSALEQVFAASPGLPSRPAAPSSGRPEAPPRPSPSTPPPPPPRARGGAPAGYLGTFAGYQLLRRLRPEEVTGTGEGYIARMGQDGEEVEVRVLLPRVAVSEGARRTFLEELAALKGLHHQNVLSVLGFGHVVGAFYVVYERLPGLSVDALVRARGALPVADATDVALQTLVALQYIHEKTRALHRDISARTVVVYRPGQDEPGPAADSAELPFGVERRVKVADAGLARAYRRAGLADPNMTGDCVGTPAFMPRQQLLNFKDMNPAHDVWAAAALLYYLLTGASPRSYASDADLWKVTLTEPPIPIRERRADVPQKLARVLDAALDDRKDLRYESAQSFAAALREGLW